MGEIAEGAAGESTGKGLRTGEVNGVVGEVQETAEETVAEPAVLEGGENWRGGALDEVVPRAAKVATGGMVKAVAEMAAGCAESRFERYTTKGTTANVYIVRVQVMLLNPKQTVMSKDQLAILSHDHPDCPFVFLLMFSYIFLVKQRWRAYKSSV
jgi:hypothetical protein